MTKCLISTCDGKIKNKDQWKVEGAVDIRSYITAKGEKLYNVTFQMIDGHQTISEGIINKSLKKCLREIAKYFD